MWNYEKYGLPFNEGEYTYFSRNDGLQNQSVYYRQKNEGNPELFIDPNTFSADGTTSLGEMGFSKDGSKVAYSVSEGGSDWRKVIILDAITKKIIGDTLIDIKFSGISWQGNEGFYYSSYDKPKGSELSAMTDQHKLYYHKLGTSQSEDKVIFGADKKRRYVGGYVTEDDRFLVVTASISTTGNELYIKDLTKKSSEFRVIVANFDNDHYLLDNEGSKLFIFTNLNAPNWKIVTVDAEKSGIENWVDFIPETENVLQPSTGSGYIFANYLERCNLVCKTIRLKWQNGQGYYSPGYRYCGQVFSGKREIRKSIIHLQIILLHLRFTKWIPRLGKHRFIKSQQVLFNGDDYISEQVFYKSKDGTQCTNDNNL